MKNETHNSPVEPDSAATLKEMPADGGGRAKGMPDGVSGSPDTGEIGQVNGRSGGGESGGGAYPNPHSGKAPASDGFLGHGGQTDNAYYGGDNPNATTKPSGVAASEPGPGPVTELARQPHVVEAGGQTFEVVEESGAAAAVATGKVAADANNEREHKTPAGG